MAPPLVRGGRPGLFLRGHLPRLDPVEDLDPSGEVLGPGEVALDRREVEPALLLLGAVAFETVPLEERLGVWQGRLGGERDEEDGGHAITRPAIVPFDVENSLVSIPRRCSIET